MKKTLLVLSIALGSTLGTVPLCAQKLDPKVIDAPSPGYPIELTDTGLSGAAEVDIVVKADGTVADARLAMANHRAFGRVALAAVSTWHFQPASVDGKAVDTKVSVPFRFTAPFDQQVNALAKRKVFAELAEPALSQKDYGTKLKVKKSARPIYPRSLSSGGDEEVKVSFIVAPDGTTLNPTIVGKPRADFVLPALQAVAGMTYEPPLKGGKGVYVEASTTIEFSEDRGRGREGGGGGGGGRRGGGGGGGSRGGDGGEGGFGGGG